MLWFLKHHACMLAEELNRLSECQCSNASFFQAVIAIPRAQLRRSARRNLALVCAKKVLPANDAIAVRRAGSTIPTASHAIVQRCVFRACPRGLVSLFQTETPRLARTVPFVTKRMDNVLVMEIMVADNVCSARQDTLNIRTATVSHN
jgi:hypothetical protein